MYNVGLIGGVASGKTTVSQEFAALGARIISADVIAKQLTAQGQPAYETIVQHLGVNFISADGELDRRRLRDTITQDTEVRTWLENLLHPLIRQQMELAQKDSQAAYNILEIPVLKNSQAPPYLQRILWVRSSHEQQLQRLMARDNVMEKQAEDLIACQMPRSLLETLADDEIVNSGNLQGLIEQVRAWHQRYSDWSTAV